MTWKVLGSVLVILSCGTAGFTTAALYKKELSDLQSFLRALVFMECELEYRLTPLPELCFLVRSNAKGVTGEIFAALGEEMERQISPDVGSCMHATLRRFQGLPQSIETACSLLGSSLGTFDLEGQIKGLESVRDHCMLEIKNLSDKKHNRVRSYQTLGLCAGAALAVLLI